MIVVVRVVEIRKNKKCLRNAHLRQHQDTKISAENKERRFRCSNECFSVFSRAPFLRETGELGAGGVGCFSFDR
jgi:hypothetical protein